MINNYLNDIYSSNALDLLVVNLIRYLEMFSKKFRNLGEKLSKKEKQISLLERLESLIGEIPVDNLLELKCIDKNINKFYYTSKNFKTITRPYLDQLKNTRNYYIHGEKPKEKEKNKKENKEEKRLKESEQFKEAYKYLNKLLRYLIFKEIGMKETPLVDYLKTFSY